MLRSIFVAAIIAVGVVSSFRGPFYALLFYLWFAYFRPEGWLHTNWVGGLRLSLIAGILALVMAVVRPDDLKPRLNLGICLLLAALVQTFASTLNSVAPDWSMLWWMEFAKLIIIGLLLTMAVNTPQRLRITVFVIVLSLGFEAVKQGWVQLLRNPGGSNANEHFVLGDNNGVALGMFMLAPLAGALVATSRGLERRWHLMFLGGLVLRGLSTYSRGGFLTAIAVAIFSTARARHRFRMLLATAVLAGVFLALMPQRFWDRMGTITASEQERDASTSGRLYFWQVAIAMAAEHPLTGVGFNAYSKAFDDYDTSGGLYGRGRAVHSAWFGMLAENGYPGFMIFVLLVATNFFYLRQILNSAKDHKLDSIAPFARGMQGSLLAFCVGGTFLNGHYNELLWDLFALTIALHGITQDEVSRSQEAIGLRVGETVTSWRPPAVSRGSEEGY